MKFVFLLPVLLAALPLTASAHLVITLAPGPSGELTGTMTGTLQVPSFYAVSGNLGDSPEFRYSADPLESSLRWVTFNSGGANLIFTGELTLPFASGNPQALALNRSGFAIPIDLKVGEVILGMEFGNTPLFILSLLGATQPGTITFNESFAYPAVSFADFNPGVWTFGDTSDPISGNGVTFTIVPESGTAICGGVALAAALFRRRVL